MSELQILIDEYIAFCFQSDPIGATRLGMHKYDNTLGEVTPDTIEEEISKRWEFLSRVQKIDPSALEPDAQMDHLLAARRGHGPSK